MSGRTPENEQVQGAQESVEKYVLALKDSQPSWESRHTSNLILRSCENGLEKISTL